MAATIAKAVHPNANFIDYEYGDELPDSSTFRNKHLYLLDMTFDTIQLEQLLDVAAFITVIDHHPKAIQQRDLIQGRNITLFVGDDKSGAQLTWEYFHPLEDEPDFVRWVGKRDRWLFDEPQIKPFTLGLSTLGFRLDDWVKVFTNSNGEICTKTNCQKRPETDILKKGKVIEVFQEQQVYAIIDNCQRWIELDGHRVVAVNAPKFLASEVASRLYSMYSFEQSPLSGGR